MCDKRILLVLWITQIAFLWPPTFSLILRLVAYPRYHYIHWLPIIESVCSLVCWPLELLEIGAYNQQRLLPAFFFKLQVLKSFFFTCSIAFTVLIQLRYVGFISPSLLIELALALSSFYVALIYAVYLLYRRKAPKVLGSEVTWTGTPSLKHIHTESLSPFELTSQINSAFQIVTEAPWVVELIQWIYCDSTQSANSHALLWKMIRQLLFIAKYAVGFIFVAISFPFSHRLPGEKRDPLANSPSSFDAWDYPKPAMRQDHHHDECNESTNLDRILDEESGGESFNMSQTCEEPNVDLSTSARQPSTEAVSSTRLLGPRYLCFLTGEGGELSAPKYEVRKVDNSLANSRFSAIPDYIFVSYTRKQFYTQTVFDSRTRSKSLDVLERAAARDKSALTDHAVIAAKQAGVPAFWVDFECVKPEDNTSQSQGADMEDVYRICDIVRSSHSLVIILGASLDEGYQHVASLASKNSELILEWGKRMWTVPEALLCPSEHRIAVYTVGSAEPELVAKRNLAVRVWEDADILRQLIDHYEGSLRLTQLELISIALECLSKRQTDSRNAGDVAYVLMGLLRLRPKVNKADTHFQAFARLSLANDTDKILERIISLRSPDHFSPWHNMQDLWDVKLWHLDPLYQIVAIGSNSTVVIGSASGTTIDWTSLKAVDFKVSGNHPGWLVSFCRGFAVMGLVFIGVLWFEIYVCVPFWTIVTGPIANLDKVFKLLYWIFGILLIPCMFVAILVPEILSRHFRRKFVATQARLFGVLGKPNLELVETALFGANCNRLKWQPNNGMEEDNRDTRPEFTLIDTLSCTATSFRADRPPTLAFMGAQERGKTRMLLCSYDQVLQTFVKENVIRMDNNVRQHMPRIDSFRFTVSHTPYQDFEVVSPRSSTDSDLIDIPEIPEFRSL